MKPFTLKWWLSVLVSAELNYDAACEYEALPKTLNKYHKLCNYIRQRIINKYGEQDA